MRISRVFTSRPRVIPLRMMIAGFTMCAVVSAGMPVAAAASAAAPAAASAEVSGDASAQTNKPSAEQVCESPQPGRVGCLALRRSGSSARQGVLSAAATPTGYGAADLQSAYNLPSDGGGGRTVAVVVAYDGPTAESDLAVYRSQYGLPACTTANGCFRKIDQRGGTDYPEPNSSWAGETALDLDMVSASAPAAHILLVEADSDEFEDIFAAVDQAVAQGAQYVSNSYGSGYDSEAGSGEDPAQTTEFDAHYNHPGVAMVASSGDRGYGVGYPASSQFVTAVGGTTLRRDPSTTRGWAESVWNNSSGAPGSGCSAYEPKPKFQKDIGCEMRSVTDVAAVSDLATGVAVYQTYGGIGWDVMGGTSAAAPIIAGAYAAAGAPAAGSYPNSYPYLKPSALNDVTSGNNGDCSPLYLCTAGKGYDGPTGLGSPNGLAAFRRYPNGEVSGTVTDSTGAPLTSATVTAGDYQTTVDSRGHYSLILPTGTYDLVVEVYGYHRGIASAVAVADGDAITEDFALEVAASQIVTGTVTDGSGHGWPLYATVTVEGVPGAPVYTDPGSGAFKLKLPEENDYTLKISAQYPGYQAVTKDITVESSHRTVNVAVPVDSDAGTAAGYEVRPTGPTEPFDSKVSQPAGWSIVNAVGTVGGWDFSNPWNRFNSTGGSGGFALADSDYAGANKHQDSSLVSPVYDFSDYAKPRISFDTAYRSYSGQSAAVDVTTDGGNTWATLRTWNVPTTGHIEIPLTAYAGAKALQVRFRFVATYGYWWQLDNVFIGDRPALPVSGGLVVGTVTDANTGDGVVGATVRNSDAPEETAITAATPGDPGLDDGFYWLFSSTLGKHSFTFAKTRYTSDTKTVRVTADSVAETDRSLQAGRLTIKPPVVDKTLTWGGKGTKRLTIKNTGRAPATFTLAEQADDGHAQGLKGAPLQVVPGETSPLRERPGSSAAQSAAGRAATPATLGGDAWRLEADLPVAVQDNAVAVNGGTLYSAFGYDGKSYTSDLYAYDTSSGAWSKRASAAVGRSAPARGFIDGKFYAVGGWGNDGSPEAKLEIYNPVTDTWTTGASSPKPYGGSGSAVMDGKLYVIGGCTATSCDNKSVFAYDPLTDKWSEMASYPESISWSACGAIAEVLYCAGGTTDSGATKHAYAYDLVTDNWSPIADLPTSLWGSSYTAANGLLLTIGGRAPAGITNQGFAFDPKVGAWTALPNADAPVFRGGGASGFYSVGGKMGYATQSPRVATVRVLPGYDQGDGTQDVTWLDLDRRKVTLLPGTSTTVTVALDASVGEVSRPDSYFAKLSVRTDTPYHVAPIPVTMTVNPPRGRGGYAGTVLGVDGAGNTEPLAGATVSLEGKASKCTLTTGEDGTFAVWLDARGAPLEVTVAKEGYEPLTTRVKLVGGKTTSRNFTLREAT